MPGTLAESAPGRDHRCVSGTEIGDGPRHLHDSDPGQNLAIPHSKNRRHPEPDAARAASIGVAHVNSNDPKQLPVVEEANAEVTSLIATLHQTEQRLEVLTAG